METAKRSSGLPWIYVGGMAVVVVVNAIMVTLALSTFSGLSHTGSFARGLAYNELLDRVERQEALGWQPTIAVAPPSAEGARPVSLDIVDSQGRPVAGAIVRVTLVRPVGRLPPLEPVLAEVAAGRYAGKVELPASGQWDARISVARGGDRAEFVRRMFVR
jgi:nitrogen fixation protein FixH